MKLSDIPGPHNNKKCLYAENVLEWQPAHTTTYVLPVYEIEMIVDKLEILKAKVESSTDSDKTETVHRLDTQIANWKKVLLNYRSYNNDKFPMFDAETMQFQKMVNTFTKWKEGSLNNDEYKKVVLEETVPLHGLNFIPGLAYPEFLAMSTAQSLFYMAFSVQQTCENVVPSYRNEYVSAVCNDFSASKWNDFKTAIFDACDMPELGSENISPLRNSPLVNKMCQERAAASAKDMPKGELDATGPDSMFGFMKDKTKYFTFGSSSPFTMSWTIAITDTLTQSVNLDSALTSALNYKLEAEVNVAGPYVSFNHEIDGNIDYAFTIGKSLDSSHSYERTVSVTFQDDDNGDFDPMY